MRYRRTFLALLCWTLLPRFAAAAGSDYELFRQMEKDDADASIASGLTSRWEFEMGGGLSIPISSKATFPGLAWRLFTPTSRMAVLSPPFEQSLENSAAAETAFYFHLTKSWAAGLQFGYAFGYKMDVSEQTLLDHGAEFRIVSADGARTFDAEYSMKVAELTPLLKWAPAEEWPLSRLKPYLFAGPGYYNVHEDTEISFDRHVFKFPASTHEYLGATAGFGIAYEIQPSWHLTLQGRYERVFNPGNSLQFFTPAIHLVYNL